MNRLALACLILAACAKHAPPAPTSLVHTLDLPAEQVELPDAPGRTDVLAICVGCHSVRYVLEQPPLPRKTWQAEVDKMKTAYGAPVLAENAKTIVDYLVTVRGDGT